MHRQRRFLLNDYANIPMQILGYDLRFSPKMLLGSVGLLSLQKVLTPPPFLFGSFSLFDYNAYFFDPLGQKKHNAQLRATRWVYGTL